MWINKVSKLDAKFIYDGTYMVILFYSPITHLYILLYVQEHADDMAHKGVVVSLKISLDFFFFFGGFGQHICCL